MILKNDQKIRRISRNSQTKLLITHSLLHFIYSLLNKSNCCTEYLNHEPDTKQEQVPFPRQRNPWLMFHRNKNMLPAIDGVKSRKCTWWPRKPHETETKHQYKQFVMAMTLLLFLLMTLCLHVLYVNAQQLFSLPINDYADVWVRLCSVRVKVTQSCKTEEMNSKTMKGKVFVFVFVVICISRSQFERVG